MRGILDSLPESVLAQLLEQLPQHQPHSAWMPGQLLDSTFLGKLEAQRFMGVAVFALGSDWLGGMVFDQGVVVESWRRALGGFETRAEAYRNLQASLNLVQVRLFELPEAVVQGITALLAGEVQSYHAAQIVPAQMQASLHQRQFSGAVVLEDGQAAQVWYWNNGQQPLEPTLPEAFGAGRLHLVSLLQSIPEGVVRQAEQEAAAATATQIQRLHEIVLDLLRQHVGDNADELVRGNPQVFAETNPKRLNTKIEIWLEDNFAPGLLELYRKKAVFEV
jgi:hypothetical protein